MASLSTRKEILQRLFLLLLLLAALSVAPNAAQQNPKTPPVVPKPSVPHVNPPAARPSTSRPPIVTHTSTTAVRPANTRPATTDGTIAGKTGTAMTEKTGTAMTPAGRTGAAMTSKTGIGATGKAGTGTMSGNGNGSVGRPGTSPTIRMAGGNMARGGNPGMARIVNRPAPGRQVSLRGGGMANIRPNGQIRSINRNGMHIEHGLNGTRRIESTHNGARIVTTGRNSGYVQRAYVSRNGNTYVSRTVVVNQVTYTTVYRSYSYHGYCCYYGYHPAYYYGPAYYGWAYNPWPAPVYYGWGWGGAPWYGYYGGYFAPYPVYPSAAFWLTDYVIAATLQAAYQAQAASHAAAANAAAANNPAAEQLHGSESSDLSTANSGNVTLSPEVKAAIAEEVKAQLATQQAAAKPGASGVQPASATSEQVPPALDPARRTFVVASDLAVAGDGQECQLTAGDVIIRLSDTPDDDRKVAVSVAARKKADCSAGQQVAVSVDDLQEMHNHFQEQIDKGMKDLASKQGTAGLPKAPETTTVASDVPPPPPDASAEKALREQQAQADQTEAQVVKEAFSQGS